MSNLAKEAEVQPQKLEQLQEREHLEVRKRQAIEDTTFDMLAINRPILNLK